VVPCVLPAAHGRGTVGVAGFEPATPCSQSRCATKLRHTPDGPGSLAPGRLSLPFGRGTFRPIDLIGRAARRMDSAPADLGPSRAPRSVVSSDLHVPPNCHTTMHHHEEDAPTPVKTSVETLDPVKVKLTVEVEPQRVKQAMDRAARELAKQVTHPRASGRERRRAGG
jgi:hypothetical protein